MLVVLRRTRSCATPVSGIQFVDQLDGLAQRQLFRLVDLKPLAQQFGEVEVLPRGDGMQGTDLAARGRPPVAVGRATIL